MKELIKMKKINCFFEAVVIIGIVCAALDISNIYHSFSLR